MDRRPYKTRNRRAVWLLAACLGGSGCATQQPIEQKSPILSEPAREATPTAVVIPPTALTLPMHVIETRAIEEQVEQVEITTTGTAEAIQKAEEAAIAAAARLTPELARENSPKNFSDLN